MAIWYIIWPFGIFYGHLVYFMAILNILWPFGIFYVHLEYLLEFGRFPTGIVCQEVSGNPVICIASVLAYSTGNFGILLTRKICQPCSIALV
jgi:hypothetical protein